MSAVPLDEQRARFERLWQRAFCRLRDDLESAGYRRHIRDLALARLEDGFKVYGDRCCHFDPERLEREMQEELADYIVYYCIGGAARPGP